MSETRSSQRFHSLNSEQVEVLDQVLSEVVPIHGRGNFPTLELRPRDIVIAVRARLLKQGIPVRDIRLNGSTASHVLVRDNGSSYKDLDIIFGVELPRQEDFQVIKESVLGCLLDCLPAGVNRERISSATMKEAYVQKMVKVFTEQDRWSLISLSNNSGKNLELKFVSVLRRQFEFSVDSFQIILDPLLESYQEHGAQKVASCLDNKDQASENRNKDCLPLPAPASAPKREGFESTAKDIASSERAHVSQAETKDKIEDSHEKQPQAEFSQQPKPSNQVEHPKQEKHEKVSPQTEHSSQRELTELNQLSEHTERSDQTEQLEQKEHSEEKEVLEHEKLSEREELLEPTDLPEQKELLQQVQHSDATEPPDKTEVLEHKELSNQTECSEQIGHSKQTENSGDVEQPNQTEHSNHKGLSNELELTVQKELSQHTEPLVERTELSEQLKQTEHSNPSQTELVNLAELSHNIERSCETEDSNPSNEGQSHSEEDRMHNVCVSDSDTHIHTEVEKNAHSATEKRTKTETEQETETETETERENDPEPTTEQISITEVTDVEQTLNVDTSPSCPSVSGAFPTDSTQPTDTKDTLETDNTLHIENPENTPDTLDTVKPPTSQDKLSTQPSLVSDKKTPSPPSGKAPSRLSQMVVLKHSSPKPPRRMCRKVTPNPNPNPVPEPEPVIAPSLDPDPCPSPSPEHEIITHPDPSTMSNPTSNLVVVPSTDPNPPTTIIIIPTKTDPSPSPDSNLVSKLDLTSTPDPAPDLSPDSALEPTPAEPPVPQLTTEPLLEIINPILTETLPTQVAYDTESHSESSSSAPKVTASPFKQSEPPDSPDTLVSQTDTHHTQICTSTHTSETELSDEDENRELQVEMMELDPPPSSLTPAIQQAPLSSPAPFPSDTSAIPCLVPPILNLSPHPPCFPPPSPSLSPPPSLTPPSHCLTPPMLSVSPPPSYSSPPLSFSPASSCLSSPPYLTPMLSLSPPPLCLSPPSPCLSPPLLCLTPPVESEEPVPQVSSDPEPLIQNTQGQIIQSSPQPAVPLLHSQDEGDRDRISSLPQIPAPISFPAIIQSPSSDMLPQPQPREKRGSAPPRATEVSSSGPENQEAPTVSTDMPEQFKAPRASGTVPAVEVLAESMYGDFEAAMDHLRYRLIATRNPEEIRGGGLLKYSNLLVRDYRPASETQIKTLERYMCSRFFIDFPDVQEQQRKILSYLKNHFIGEERSKYQYLMTLRRVVDDSTVCLMGHERRQTLNMITVLALKVLGEQNIIPNTDHVTCFYQPAPYLAEHSAPYLAEPSYCSYYIPQGGSTLLYQPYPLHLHTQTGLV